MLRKWETEDRGREWEVGSRENEDRSRKKEKGIGKELKKICYARAVYCAINCGIG